jgi:tellurite resistance protein TerC
MHNIFSMLALATPINGAVDHLAVPAMFWVGFGLFIGFMLALDLGVFNRHHHVVSLKEAITWSVVWIMLALLFGAGLYVWQTGVGGGDHARQILMAYLTGYIVELSLSIDNLFVIAIIFAYFRVPREDQHSVLFWGILGALVMRAILIFLGVELIHRFHWMIYVFGFFLVVTGIKMVVSHGKEMEPEKNPVIKLFRKLMPVTDDYRSGKFFTRVNGKAFATPLFIALLMVEVTDLIFAVDSIPAILAITSIPFIVVTSNAFAVMGLRSMYFALAGFIASFHLLHYGLSAVLVFIGVKMLIIDIYHVPIGASLAVVVALIAISVIASILIKPDHDREGHGTHADGTVADVLPEDLYPGTGAGPGGGMPPATNQPDDNVA